MNDPITMRVTLEIYQQGGGALRCTEEISMHKPLTIVQAAEILQRFSLLAQEVKSAQ
jgi:hypothetical protein